MDSNEGFKDIENVLREMRQQTRDGWTSDARLCQFADRIERAFFAIAALPSDIAKPDAPQPFTADEPFDGGSLTLGAIKREREPKIEPAQMVGDDRVLWGVVANAGRMSYRRGMRWSHVVDATGLGSQSSIALCLRFGFDPDENVGGSEEDRAAMEAGGDD